MPAVIDIELRSRLVRQALLAAVLWPDDPEMRRYALATDASHMIRWCREAAPVSARRAVEADIARVVAREFGMTTADLQSLPGVGEQVSAAEEELVARAARLRELAYHDVFLPSGGQEAVEDAPGRGAIDAAARRLLRGPACVGAFLLLNLLKLMPLHEEKEPSLTNAARMMVKAPPAAGGVAGIGNPKTLTDYLGLSPVKARLTMWTAAAALMEHSEGRVVAPAEFSKLLKPLLGDREACETMLRWELDIRQSALTYRADRGKRAASERILGDDDGAGFRSGLTAEPPRLQPLAAAALEAAIPPRRSPDFTRAARARKARG